MEELRTTEVLDREILEDARKKAYKILKALDETLAAQTSEWEKKISGAIVSVKNVFAERQKKLTEEIFARLPLDKRRLRSESSEGFLIKSMDDFLNSLKRETLLSVLKFELSGRVKICIEDDLLHNAEVKYSGISLSEAAELLKDIPGSNKWVYEQDPVSRKFPYIEINTEAIKITASVESAAAALLKEKRAELAAALFGEGVLND